MLLHNAGLPRLPRYLGVACLFCGCACLGPLCAGAKPACHLFPCCMLPPFPVCQSLARMSLAVYSRCSLARWISYLSLCCMLFCTPPMGQGLSPSNWLHPSGAFSAWLREGHWPPENKPLPGGAGGVALWPSRRLLPGRNGLRTGLTGLNQVPAATRPLDCLKTMLGTLSWYMWPTKGFTSHPAPTKTSGWCALPEVIVFAALHRRFSFHAPNRQGRPSGRKHQEGLVFPSSPQGVSKGFPSSPRDKG